jgi:hypothetical protein
MCLIFLPIMLLVAQQFTSQEKTHEKTKQLQPVMAYRTYLLKGVVANKVGISLNQVGVFTNTYPGIQFNTRLRRVLNSVSP